MANKTRTPPPNKIYFSAEQTDFLKSNYTNMTNKQLADALGVTLTVMRNYKSKLGLLSATKPANWSKGETNYLIENYRKIGDKELAEQINDRYAHKNRNFTRKHIRTKRDLLGLKRSDEEIAAIVRRNVEQGRYNTSVKKPKKPMVLNRLFTGHITFD
jgi:hypothetical protein